MGFEFLVQKGYTPIALYVKGVRFDLTRMGFPNAPDYPDIKQRDKAIENGKAIGGEPGVPSKPLVYADVSQKAFVIDTQAVDAHKAISLTNTVPPNGDSAAIIFGKDNIGALIINDDRLIIGGEYKFKLTDLAKNRGIDSKLQVRQFFEGRRHLHRPGRFRQRTPSSAPSSTAPAQEASGEIVLVDARGRDLPRHRVRLLRQPARPCPLHPRGRHPHQGRAPLRRALHQPPRSVLHPPLPRRQELKITEMKIGSTKIAEMKPPLIVKK